MMQENIIPHTFHVEKSDRERLNGHRGLLVWFTGLSGSGKSTLANALEKHLVAHHMHTYTLDGDTIRKGLNKNLSFSPEDREENIRRIAEVAHLMVDAGLVVLAAFVSPYRKDREGIRTIVGKSNFAEIFVNTPLEECEKRDVKGLYAKARAGLIKDFTGVNAPYEMPLKADIEIDTITTSVEEAVAIIFERIKRNLILDNE
ncbi:MAG: adenylyl-sulfate kinase [Flavobacteriaceae bacterium]|mgnify:CR=1 FL=1